jgi:hypothetical protein
MAVPFSILVCIAAAIGGVIYLLWPTWPRAPGLLDSPEIPVTVAGVLFEVPPAAIRAAVQRHPGPTERIDLAFAWPLLSPAQRAAGTDSDTAANDAGGKAADGSARVFVTIAALGTVLPPAERVRTIYPRYVEAEANAGPDGLAILPFRAGTPYDGEDLVYLAGSPEQFFVRCTRQVRGLRGSCLHERLIENAEITLRFPRDWLEDWRGVAAGFDRLLAQLHPPRG